MEFYLSEFYGLQGDTLAPGEKLFPYPDFVTEAGMSSCHWSNFSQGKGIYYLFFSSTS